MSLRKQKVFNRTKEDETVSIELGNFVSQCKTVLCKENVSVIMEDLIPFQGSSQSSFPLDLTLINLPSPGLWANIPSDIFGHVMNFIPDMDDLINTSLVCREWRQNLPFASSLLVQSIQDSDVSLSDDGNSVVVGKRLSDSEQIIQIGKKIDRLGKLANIQHLTLDNLSPFTEYFLMNLLLAKCPKVSLLTIGFCKNWIPSTSPTVNTLPFISAKNLHTIIAPNRIIEFRDGLVLPKLTRLQAKGYTTDLAKTTPHLTSLDITSGLFWCSHSLPKSVRSVTIRFPDDDAMCYPLENYTDQFRHVSTIRIICRNFDKVLKYMANKLQYVQHLILQGYEFEVFDNSLLAKLPPQITFLTLEEVTLQRFKAERFKLNSNIKHVKIVNVVVKYKKRIVEPCRNGVFHT